MCQVHVFFTISAIAGQLTAGLIFVPAFGHNRSFVVTPICYALSSFLFFHMSTMGFRLVKHRKSNTKNWIMAILHPFWLFAVSFFVGARIMFSSRNTFWLIPGYGFASYAHRYLDTCIVPQIAKRILARPSISLVIAAGTSFGELLGALIIFCWTKHFRTPLFWLRIDACLLLLVWFFPFWAPDEAEARQVLIAVAFMVPLAFAWAAYDVSITAYVQAALTRLEHTSPHIASLSAVVCFVYCLQVAMYGSMSTLIRTYLDKMGPGDAIQGRLIWTAGVQFTVISIVVIASSFIPEGSRALNPRMIASRKLDEDIDQSGVEGTSEGAETHGTGTANGQETTEVELEGTTEPKMEQRSIRRTFFNIAGFAARARSWMAGLGKTPWREVRSRSCSHVQNGEDGLTSPTG